MKKIILILLLFIISCHIFASDPIHQLRLNHLKYQIMHTKPYTDDKIFSKTDYVMSGISVAAVATMNYLYLSNNKSWTHPNSDKVYHNTPFVLVVLDGMLLFTQIRYYLKKS